MIPVTACTHCQVLSLNPVGVFCASPTCAGVFRPVEGLMIEPQDVAKMAANEGDRLVAECGKALNGLFSKRGKE
jgi:hypothetical protein